MVNTASYTKIIKNAKRRFYESDRLMHVCVNCYESLVRSCELQGGEQSEIDHLFRTMKMKEVNASCKIDGVKKGSNEFNNLSHCLDALYPDIPVSHAQETKEFLGSLVTKLFYRVNFPDNTPYRNSNFSFEGHNSLDHVLIEKHMNRLFITFNKEFNDCFDCDDEYRLLLMCVFMSVLLLEISPLSRNNGIIHRLFLTHLLVKNSLTKVPIFLSEKIKEDGLRYTKSVRDIWTKRTRRASKSVGGGDYLPAMIFMLERVKDSADLLLKRSIYN